jgi:DNA-binding CsgD family transcriptional regulator
MATTALERGVKALVGVCQEGPDERTLFEEAAARLRKLVPFDGSAWFATDPGTVLGTSPLRIENVETGHCTSYWERECQVEDTLLFRDLARSRGGAGTLYESTGDQPARSARYREFLAPQGYGDELRAAFRVGRSTWGVVDLFRTRGAQPFSPDDVAVVRSVAPALGGALRSLSGEAGQGGAPDVVGPGTVLFDRAGNVLSLDEEAEVLLTELGGPGWGDRPLPLTAVYAVVARAGAVAEGRDRGPATARLRTGSGRWLTVHASCLRGRNGGPGPTALTIEPATSSQIAPIIIEAYRLTEREQEITRAVARGLSNAEIAAELFLSTHTVRDHLKAVFGKLGVTSRGELVAKLFAEHYGPAMHAPSAVVDHVEV